MLASELVAQVRRLSVIGTGPLTDADVLAHADMEITAHLLPEVRRVQEEYYVRTIDVTSVGNRIVLPARAQGAGVRLVQLLMPGGYTPRIPRLQPEDMVASTAAPTPLGFIFDGGGIQFVPTGSSGTARIWYYCSPSKLVLESTTSRASLISAVAADTPTAGRTRLTFASATVASPVDVVSAGPAHELLVIGSVAANVTTTTLDVPTSAILGPISAGDYVTSAGYTPFVQLPEEMGSALVSAVSARALMSLGYNEEAGPQAAMAKAAMVDALEYIRPRSDGNPKRVRGGLLNSWSRAGFPVWFRWG